MIMSCEICRTVKWEDRVIVINVFGVRELHICSRCFIAFITETDKISIANCDKARFFLENIRCLMVKSHHEYLLQEADVRAEKLIEERTKLHEHFVEIKTRLIRNRHEAESLLELEQNNKDLIGRIKTAQSILRQSSCTVCQQALKELEELQ